MALNNWARSIQITISGIGTELSDFTVPVFLNDTSGPEDFDCLELFEELSNVDREVTTTDPISYWTMEDINSNILKDEKGNIDGTINNVPILTGEPFNNYAKAGDVSSIARYIEFTNISFTSISLWVRREDLTRYTSIISDNSNYLIVHTDGYLYFYNGDSSTLYINDLDWHHVVLIEGQNNNYHWIYLDGVKSTTDLNSNFSGSFKYFGRSTTASNEESAYITEAQLFNYKLTDTEINDLFNTTKKAATKKIAIEYEKTNVQCLTEIDFWEYTYDNYTRLLVHSNTYNNSTFVLDATKYGHTNIVNGDTHHSTTQKKFSNTSIYLNGNGDFIVFDKQTYDNLKEQDFTIDLWFYQVSVIGGWNTLIAQWDNNVGSWYIGFDQNNSKLVFQYNDDAGGSTVTVSTDFIPSLNTWYHLAVVRNTTTLKIYVNGSLETSYNIGSVGLSEDSSYIIISSYAASGVGYFNGYIDEVRISKGIARWTNTFTPPTVPYKRDYKAVIYTKIPALHTDSTLLTLYYDKIKAPNTQYIGYTNQEDLKPKCIQGLYLEPDTSPYTATTLSEDNTVANGHLWNGQVGGEYFNQNYSYGFQLKEATLVEYLMCYCTHDTSNTYTTYYGASYDSFKVFYSDDNTSWTLIQAYNAPPIVLAEPSHCGIKFEFNTPVLAKYFKIVAIDTIAFGSGGASAVCREVTAFISNPATKAWDNNFKAVYHLSQDPSTTILDSTVNKHNLISDGSMTSSDLVLGVTSKATHFDGVDDILTTTNNDFSILEQNYTIESLTKWISTSQYAQLVTIGSSTTGTIQHGIGANTSKYGIQVGGDIVDSSFDISTTLWQHAVSRFTKASNLLELFIDGNLAPENNNVSIADLSNTNLIIGARFDGYYSNAIQQEVRISNTPRSSAWLKATYQTLKDNTNTFQSAFLQFNDVRPINASIVYGDQQRLAATVTTSGGTATTYDAYFYRGNDTLIDVVSGVPIGTPAYTYLSTPAIGFYDWYLYIDTQSISGNSPIYHFELRYLCSGICEDLNGPVSGININLHRRANGELVATTTTAGTGTFKCGTPYNEQHYAVALHPDTNINALIYDKLSP